MKNSSKASTLKNSLIQNLKLTSNTSFYKGIIVVLLTSLLMFLTSCKKDYGEVVTRELNLAQFSSISSSSDVNIAVEYGAVQKVEVYGNIEILDRIKTEVTNFNLNIDLKDGVYSNYELAYKITIPKIENITIKGDGNISIGEFNQTDDLSLDISGSGNINFYAFPNIQKIKVDISGSGGIVAQSPMDSLKNLDIDISGSGEYTGYPVKTKNATVDISGSGNVNLYAIDNLGVKISGSGNVNYKGFPNIDSNITGSGNISNKN